MAENCRPSNAEVLARQVQRENKRLTARVAELEGEIQKVIGHWEKHSEMIIDRDDKQIADLQAENARLRTALEKLWKHTPKIDNGYCAVCRRGYRSFDLEGRVSGKCSDRDCISHVVEAALSSAPVADPQADAMESLRALQPGWDNDGAPAIDPLLIALAEVIRTKPQFVPTLAGGVQIEWHTNGFDIEIEIGPDGTMTAWNSAEPEPQADPVRKTLEETK